eukprot:scaffold3603_cov192-Pinguiococcus_pyrenoidosus.AAC.1
MLLSRRHRKVMVLSAYLVGCSSAGSKCKGFLFASEPLESADEDSTMAYLLPLRSDGSINFVAEKSMQLETFLKYKEFYSSMRGELKTYNIWRSWSSLSTEKMCHSLARTCRRRDHQAIALKRDVSSLRDEIDVLRKANSRLEATLKATKRAKQKQVARLEAEVKRLNEDLASLRAAETKQTQKGQACKRRKGRTFPRHNKSCTSPCEDSEESSNEAEEDEGEEEYEEEGGNVRKRGATRRRKARRILPHQTRRGQQQDENEDPAIHGKAMGKCEDISDLWREIQKLKDAKLAAPRSPQQQGHPQPYPEPYDHYHFGRGAGQGLPYAPPFVPREVRGRSSGPPGPYPYYDPREWWKY